MMNNELRLMFEMLEKPGRTMISAPLLKAALGDIFDLVDQLAGMTTESEMDEAGEPMSGDDACSTLSSVIEWARQHSDRRPG